MRNPTPRRALSRSRSALACGVPLFHAPRAAAILFRSGALRPALAARRPAPRGLSLGAYVPCVPMSRLKGGKSCESYRFGVRTAL